MKTEPCCEKWSTANDAGSGDGLRGLIYPVGGEFVFDGLFKALTHPIRFCPWCGAEKPQVKST